MKSVCIAYLLLLIGGLIGLHLLYLRRDKQAFIYWCTFGGYFGLAPLRDLFYIPTYVREANDDPSYFEKLAAFMLSNKNPPFSTVRFVAQILIGNSWCFLLISSVPNEPIFGVSLFFLKYLGPLAAALGVCLIGNIGRVKANLVVCVIGAYAILPFVFIHFEMINWCCISSSVLCEWKGKSWRRTPGAKTTLCKRVLYLYFGWTLFCTLWMSYIFFNAEISYKDGEKAKVKDAIHNFFKSPMFLDFKNNLWKLYEDIQEQGWSQAWVLLIELLDPLGEQHAMKVLGIEKGMSQEQISSRYKNLTKEWHPDRHKTEEMKRIAQEKFVEITEAYEKLSSLKQRRNRKNMEFELKEAN